MMMACLVSDLLILKIYDSFCVAAIMVMCIILIVSNDDNKQKFEERTNGVTQSEATLLDLMRKVYFHFGIFLGLGFSKSDCMLSDCRPLD
jgi:hypothetical protein